MTKEQKNKLLAKLVPTTKEIASVLRHWGIKDVSKEKRIYFYMSSVEKGAVWTNTLENVDALSEKGFIFSGMTFRTGKDMRNRAYMCRMSVKSTAKHLRRSVR